MPTPTRRGEIDFAEAPTVGVVGEEDALGLRLEADPTVTIDINQLQEVPSAMAQRHTASGSKIAMFRPLATPV
jgi:hypothetical protein